MIYRLGERVPTIADDCWIAPGATLIGSVTVAARANIWFNAVIRADNDEILIGEDSNIQESCVLHTDAGIRLRIGKGCTVGHMAMLHGCDIGDHCLIGIGAVILNGAKIGNNCLVGAKALITENKQFPDNSLIVGAPARVARRLSDEEVQKLQGSGRHYVANARRFREQLQPLERGAPLMAHDGARG